MLACHSGTYKRHAQNLQEFTINHDGYQRSYFIYVPNKPGINGKIPLLFALHGGGGTAKGMPGFTLGRFHELAEEHGFIVVYPQGVEKQWNDGRKGDQVKAWKENIDDVGFLVGVVKKLEEEYPIDKGRVFTCGISNGGFMSTRLACERPDVFKGAAIVTATISKDFYPYCKPQLPTAVLIMNGTEDKLVPYQGGTIKILGKTRGEVLSTDDYVAFWRDQNQCQTEMPTANLPDKVDDGTRVEVKEYKDCLDGGGVVLYTVHGGGHTWPGGLQYLGENLVGRTSRDIIACDVVWEYFASVIP